MFSISLIFKINSKGPKIEPWGTPHFISCSPDLTLYFYNTNYKRCSVYIKTELYNNCQCYHIILYGCHI